jgi:uncharacterized cupin superfamily protein
MTDYDPGDPTELMPGALVAALTADLRHEPLPDAHIVAGSPTTATLVLDETGGREIGVWEMTPGTATDVEVDEVFVVIAGNATVVFDEVPDATPPPAIELAPGALVRLTAGMRTTWTVHETLRKIYVA